MHAIITIGLQCGRLLNTHNINFIHIGVWNVVNEFLILYLAVYYDATYMCKCYLYALCKSPPVCIKIVLQIALSMFMTSMYY